MTFRHIAGFASIILVFLMLPSAIASAQTITLDNLPPATGNDRFISNLFQVTHPSLSANGFDCGTNCDDGQGLKQILEGVYNDRTLEFLDPYVRVLTQANQPLISSPSSRRQYETNTIRIEARAFVALVTYILEQNGESISALNGITAPDLPSHAQAAQRLREGFVNPSAEDLSDCGSLDCTERDFPFAVINQYTEEDAVKWTASLTHIARAMDLYLALENAYQYYGDPDYGDTGTTDLLSEFDKEAVMGNYARETDDLDDLGNLDIIIDGSGVSRDEVQPGNWPMKVHVAVGYAALMQQDVNVSHPYQHWVRRALRSAGGPTDQNRSYHWHYQTGNVNNSGPKRFWAEGPYYLHFSLREIIPFWHAIRINGMLNYHPDYSDYPVSMAWDEVASADEYHIYRCRADYVNSTCNTS